MDSKQTFCTTVLVGKSLVESFKPSGAQSGLCKTDLQVEVGGWIYTCFLSWQMIAFPREMSDCFYQAAAMFACLSFFVERNRYSRSRQGESSINLNQFRHWALNTTQRYFCVTLKIDKENYSSKGKYSLLLPKDDNRKSTTIWFNI